MRAPLLLITASGLARETASVCQRIGGGLSPGWAGGPLIGFLDDDPAKFGTDIGGVPVLGPLDAVTEHPDAQVVICAGKGTVRRDIASRLAGLGVTPERYATVIEPGVHVPASCVVGSGSVMLAGTVLTAAVTIGEHVVCMPNVTLTHDDVLGDFATLAAGVVLGGGVHVGEGAYLGMNSCVRENHRVGAGATLGMGAVLLRDQPANSTWAGIPARPLDLQEAPQ